MEFQISDGRSVTVEADTCDCCAREFAVIVWNDTEPDVRKRAIVHHYVTGTRKLAEESARKLAAGINFDLAYMANRS
jgi:hypothetical protein